MQNAEGPGDIPEWRKSIQSMSPAQRAAFALALGVTERTVYSWSKGERMPSEGTVKRICAQLRKAKKCM